MTLPRILYLFPDTNVFLQCKPLDQVDWSTFGEWERVELLLTRPVQTEIDSHKGKGNSRQAARARNASALIRQLLDAVDGCISLCLVPCVRICLRHALRRDESIADVLNYDERDDQLVGTALAFKKANTSADVRLLTNDTGPMASAKAVGLAYYVIPHEWILPPESAESEKREKALKAEIEMYKNAEPSFGIAVQGQAEVRATVKAYPRLSDNEVDSLMHRLVTRFPMATDFGLTNKQVPSTSTDAVLIIASKKEVFEPASPTAVAQYKEDYAQWKQLCTEALFKLNNTLTSRMLWPDVTVSVGNGGSRPAQDTVVVFEAEGDFWLRPPKRKDDRSAAVDIPTLARPPSVPTGTWKRVNYGFGSDALAQITGRATHLSDLLKLPHLAPPPSRDPNGIYFKKGMPGSPSKVVEYTCEQWRHAHAPEEFKIAILCPLQPGAYSGLMKVTVHAANLTVPEIFTLPLRLIVVEDSCFDVATQLVENISA